ncbi:U3 small nucleolar RNA-associated protein 15 [Candida viswanathii]|uniref:U3 small nucleolar RNA-associated protein 15 n=1 Tax=Candida viswanathii TaxID=5486 RepID=A0A367YLY0_9ASCO|nr:U3 small nucleolar RNA-associated protein 15 [Candida viswanathii]
MSSAKQALPQARAPTLPSKTTPEQRYWRSYINPQLIKENHPINSIEFNPATNDFAVASSTKIQVFSGKTRQVVKTYSRFKDVVYCGNYRHDGKLLVAADASGLVSIYDCFKPNNLLVSWVPSALGTRVAKFNPVKGNHVVTGGNDKKLCIFDITQTSTPLVSIDAHDDYVSSVSYMDTNLLASGSFDGSVKLWDVRAPESAVASFDQGNPVADVVVMGSLVVAAGGPVVNVFDLNLNRPIHLLENFTKATTCLAPTHNNQLIVGSLDGTSKVFDADWKVVFGYHFSAPVLSCAANEKHFATGLTSGLLTIRSRKTSKTTKAKEFAGEEDHVIVQHLGSKKVTGTAGELMANYKKSLQVENPADLNQQIREAKQAQEVCGMLQFLGV